MTEKRFQFPSHTIVMGTTNSGKTTLAKNIVEDNRQNFKSIIVISPTNEISGDWNGVRGITKIVSDYDPAMIEQLYANLLEYKKKTGSLYSTLLILDDLQDAIKDTERLWKSLIIKCRHVGLSVFILAQSATTVPPIIRDNSRYIVCGNVNTRSVDIIAEQYSKGMTKADFKRMFHSNVVNYKFLCIDNFSNGTIEDTYHILHSVKR